MDQGSGHFDAVVDFDKMMRDPSPCRSLRARISIAAIIFTLHQLAMRPWRLPFPCQSLGCAEILVSKLVGKLLASEDGLVHRVVVQVRPEPALDLGDAHALALGVVGDLVAVDLAEAEVARLGVGEVEPAHARAGPHGERLGDHACRCSPPRRAAPERALLGVIGAGRIAGGRADAAVLLVDELVGASGASSRP